MKKNSLQCWTVLLYSILLYHNFRDKKKIKKFYNAYFIACNAHLCLYYNRLVTVFVVVKSLNFRHKPIVFLLVKIKLIYDCTLPSKAKSHILFKEQMRSPKCTFNDCLSIQQMVQSPMPVLCFIFFFIFVQWIPKIYSQNDSKLSTHLSFEG